MELKYRVILLLFVLISFYTRADDEISHLIKQQSNADLSVFKAQKVYRQDVYSSTEKRIVRLKDLPAEENCFTITNLIPENNFLSSKAERVIKNEILGHCIGRIGIVKIATALQDVYINAGYITTRVTLPSQDISTGSLKLRVEPGRIEKIIVENDDINTWMLPFKAGDILNIRDIEQGLENLQLVPDVDVKMNIEPGTRQGYSVIRIKTLRTKEWSIRASVSNWGDKETGRYLTSVVGYLYNTAHLSDLFYLAGTRSTTGKYESASGYYMLPAGYWNYSLFYSRSKSRQAIPLSDISVDYAGKSDYWSAKASRTVYRDRSRIVTGNAELIRRKAGYKINGQELVLQKRNMDNVKFGVNYKQQLEAAAWDSTLSWQRFVTWFGAEKTADMVYGDVSSVSQIFSLESRYSRQLGNHIYSATLFGQYAPHELTLQDKTTLGERWNVRGFENSPGFTGSKGYYLQNTIYHPVKSVNASYYYGLDAGQIKKDSVYGDELIAGGAVGIQGQIKSLTYDCAISVPVKYPGAMNVDKATLNLNLSYQL